MGCIPWRCIFHHRARNHRSKIRISKRRGRGGNHHHVALTSSTYGYLKHIPDDNTDPSAFTTPRTDTMYTTSYRTATGTGDVGTDTGSSSQDNYSDMTTSLKAMTTKYEDFCTDKEVVLIKPSPVPANIRDFSGGEPDVSSSSSNFDPYYQQPHQVTVVDVDELMEGLEDEYSRLLTPPEVSIYVTPPKKHCPKRSPRGATKSPRGSRWIQRGAHVDHSSGGKRRFPRSSSLSAARESCEFSPSVVERLFRDMYSFYVASAGRKLLPSRPKEMLHPLDAYEMRCPPGGESVVVLYYTSLRGIRRTFEDCQNLRIILQSFGVSIDDRDISMDAEFKTELKQLFKEEPAVRVPKLFIKGRLIGGLAETRRAHEEGMLVKMLEGIRREDPFHVCDGCGGFKFMPCLECCGSCKLVDCEEEGMIKVSRCPDCNENGLIRCPICC